MEQVTSTFTKKVGQTTYKVNVFFAENTTATLRSSAGAMENRQLLLLPTVPAKSLRTNAQVLSMTLQKSVVWYLQKFHFRHTHRRNTLTGMYYGMRWKW